MFPPGATVPYDPERLQRRSIRLRGYDYTQAGLYFVTICVENRACLFGKILDSTCHFSAAGEMIARWWDEIPVTFADVDVDAFVIMPNHVHGIVFIGTGVPDSDSPAIEPGGHMGPPLPETRLHAVGADPCVRPPDQPHGANLNRSPSLPAIVQWFKTMTTNDYIRGVKQDDWPPFNKRLWQRNYHDHIIRNDRALDRLRDYVAGNPSRWAEDTLHPDNPSDWESRLR